MGATRLQFLVALVTMIGVAVTITFPPWIEVSIQEGSPHSHPHCCFDAPLWDPPAPVHDEELRVDWPRLARQLGLFVAAGVGLFLVAGRAQRARRTRSAKAGEEAGGGQASQVD